MIEIHFGTTADTISKQLYNQGIHLPEETCCPLQRCADSIIMLHLHGLIPDSVRDSARKKLMNKLVKELNHPVTKATGFLAPRS